MGQSQCVKAVWSQRQLHLYYVPQPPELYTNNQLGAVVKILTLLNMNKILAILHEWGL